MRDPQSVQTFYRKDYQAFPYRIIHADLKFDLNPESTTVTSKLEFQRLVHNDQPMTLDGESLQLVSIALNGKTLSEDQYQTNDTELTIKSPGETGVLEIVVTINPSQNTRLEGLYVSNGNFFTQCEAQGFRRITYFPDRPDVLTKFTVSLTAPKSSHPVLLSNGNLIHEEELSDSLHTTTWEDPFPKPSYLFALVAGKFECQEETIVKGNGKPALLQVWVEPGNLDKTDFAMQSLKHSIRWDYERFGLDLDLDRFMIVATADFNMGAMENKGLNIFNTKFVFANPWLATDTDFEHVESVVGHEYFHNWTGNRVTCRDWFQLSLKEGLTVFRDQEFTGDMLAKGLDDQQAKSARAVKRIDDVKVLRAAQFPEDAGPMAHPIRPDSYQEINNFYTITVYEKGAEVIRMQHTLLGEAIFQRGMQIYFDRHDGQAVTCDDFVDAMESALRERQPNASLGQFRHWYAQAGTPTVTADWNYEEANQRFVLKLRQSCAPTPGQPTKPAFHIPIKLGLLNSDGSEIALELEADEHLLQGDVLTFNEKQQEFAFVNVPVNPVPSLLRGFSAPIRLFTQHSLAERIFLALTDNDPFNRWDAGQEIYSQAILEIYNADGDIGGALAKGALKVVEAVLLANDLSDGFKALALQLPSEGTLFEAKEGLVDPVKMHHARSTLKQAIATHCFVLLSDLYQAKHDAKVGYQYNAIEAGKRSLKNVILGYLSCLDEDCVIAKEQFRQANNMTDKIAALTAIAHHTMQDASEIEAYYEEYQGEALAIDKWFMVQATKPVSVDEMSIQKVTELLNHPDFTLKNPNRARSVIAAFSMQNPSLFHAHDGSGYSLWADNVIALNSINPQVAARMSRALDRWTKLEPALQVKAKNALEKVYGTENLSTDVKEIVGKALGQ